MPRTIIDLAVNADGVATVEEAQKLKLRGENRLYDAEIINSADSRQKWFVDRFDKNIADALVAACRRNMDESILAGKKIK